MIGKLLNKEEVSAGLVLALSGTIMVLVAKGNGPLSPDWLLSRVLSNPVSGFEPTGGHGGSVAAERKGGIS